MYMFAVFNTFADLAMLWLLILSSRADDRAHPLAVLVSASSGPYLFNMYPMIMNSAVFGYDAQEVKDVRETMRLYDMIFQRDATFKSIMLGTYTLVIIYGSFLMSNSLIRCFRSDTVPNRSEITMRTVLPCCAAIMFFMAFYNRMFEVFELAVKIPNFPLIVVLFVGHFLLLCSLLIGFCTMKKTENEMSDNQLEIMRNFKSLYTFIFIASIPLFFFGLQFFKSVHSRFMFSDYESFVRLIFFTSIMLLEPYNSRFRFRERFYRTNGETPVGPAPIAAPLPNKTSLVDISPPTYAPPAYETAKNLPTSWTITPPTKEYTGVQITPVEAH